MIMLTIEKAALTLDEEIYQEFKTALENGCWSSGLPLTEKQKAICNEVVYIRESSAYIEDNLINVCDYNNQKANTINVKQILH